MNAYKEYQKVVSDCVQSIEKIEMSKQEGYCVKMGLFSANLTNFLPSVPESSHEEIYKKLIKNQTLQNLDREILHLSDVSDIEGETSLVTHSDSPFIFCTFHFGSYWLLVNWLGRQNKDFSILVRQELYEQQSKLFGQYYENMIERFGITSKVNILNAEEPGILLKLAREVKSGRSLVVYLDGNTGSGKPEENTQVKFLGREIQVRKGIPYLSHLTSTPIIPVIQYRKKNFKNVMRLGKPLQAAPGQTRDEFSNESLQYIYKTFGKHIKSYPDQWEGWNYIHTALILEDEKEERSRAVREMESDIYRFNHGRYRIFEMEDNFILFDRNFYRTYEITSDLKSYLSKPAIKSPWKMLGENIFGELVSKSILI